MRYILTGFLFCVTLFNYAQVVDDFSDGDLSANPTWIGDTVNFEVDSNQKLHLDAPGVEDTSYAATVSSLVDDAEWTFLVDLDFNPSSANLARVYLMANQSDLKQSLNGYFVAIGGTSDEVSLYKQTGTAVTEIIDGIDDLVDSDPVSVRVKVSRTSAGEWTLKADNSGGFNFSNQGTVIDITHTSATYFGVFCKYTSTRSDKFYFDDIIIEPMTLVDTIAPQITSVDVVSDQVIVLWFTEKVDQFTAENTLNYTANNGLGSPSLAEVLAATPQAVELTFPPSFQEGVGYTLSVQNIQDDSGNVMLNSTIDFMYNIPFFGAYKDVVITEFMADPNPSVGLPEAEYLEIFNNTSQTISLENWTLSDGSTTITLADQPFLPQTYLLCFDPSSGASYGIINTIEGPIPTLNNSGDIIVLRDNNGLVIDSVAYSIGWYQDAQKALGGWSLELKNIDSPCHDPSNWGVSENATGGTPGYENSIYTNAPNTQAPRIQEVYIENDSVIYFVFDKNIESGNVSINPVANLSLVLIGSELKVTVSNFNLLETYQLTVAGFSDCWGNIMNDFTYLFAIPEAIEKGDVIINEVLFNPATGGSDYIEVVNISDKVLAINNLQIANIDEGLIDNIKPLAVKQILWFPGEYIVLTEDSLAVIETFPNYEPGHFIEIDLPSYNNDSGTVVLITATTNLIDKFSYREELHFALIDDLNGKALERISFNQPTQSDDNWHTASEGEGWGTPGYLNSQTSNPDFINEFQLTSAIFSPDNDGYQDVLEISYLFTNPDNVLDIVVYNANGQPIRELKDNYYPGQKGTITWDGLTNEGTKAGIGTYIIGVTVFDLEGNVKRYKLVSVLAAKL